MIYIRGFPGISWVIKVGRWRMSHKAVLEALTRGMMGEMDSITTYEEAAARSHGEVRDFFAQRAEEEKRHYNWLLEYYRALSLGETEITGPAVEAVDLPEFRPLITPDFLKAVGESQYLLAVIASAILLEFDAMKNYRHQSEHTGDSSVKQLFDRLSVWEQDHYDILVEIQAGSREFWFDSWSAEPL